MARDISDDNIQKLREGLKVLGDAVDTLAERPASEPAPIADRSLTGNKIHGGVITKFASTGLRDDATRLTVLINNDGILTDTIDVATLEGDTAVNGDLNVLGAITAQKLHVAELTTDVRQARTHPLEFASSPDDPLTGKGLHFTGDGYTKQFVYQANPGKFFSSENIDLHRGKHLSIEGQKVIDQEGLGPTVRHSDLTTVGTLKNLQTNGDLVIDNMVFWNSHQERLGIRTDAPKGILSIAGNSAEFFIDAEADAMKVGNFSANDLHIVTDDTTRITVSATGNVQFGAKGSDSTKVNVYGKLGVGVNNVDPDVSFQSAGAIKFANKKFEVGHNYPTQGTYRKGDIVWNDEPGPGTWVGWVCVIEGTPGVWKPFGQISK